MGISHGNHVHTIREHTQPMTYPHKFSLLAEEMLGPRTRDALDPEKLWKDFTFHIDYSTMMVAVKFREHVWMVFAQYALGRAQFDLITDEIVHWLRRTGRLQAYLMKVPIYRDIAAAWQMEREIEQMLFVGDTPDA